MTRVAVVVFAAALLLGGPRFAAAVPDAAVSGYQEGNRRFQEEDFPGAVEAYERALASGVTAPELEYNLANAHLKTGDLGAAVLHYRRALRLDPTYENARVNLDYARSQTRDIRPDVASGERHGWISRARLGPEGAAAAAFFALCALVVVASLRLTVWRERFGPVLLQGAAGVVLALCLAAVLFEWSQARGHGEGVLIADEIEVRSGPGDTHTVSFRLHEGAEVELLRRAPGWWELRVSEGLQGWVPETAVEEI